MFVSREVTLFKKILNEVSILEKIGNYDRAIQLLSEIWTDISDMPDLTGLTSDVAAEMLLRCGAVIGYLGNAKSIPGSQDHAKNLLTAARSRYLEIGNIEKICECENFLALAYYHRGEFEEAIIWVEQSLIRHLPPKNNIRLHTHIIKSMILLAEKNYRSAISYLDLFKTEFEAGAFWLRGSFSSNKSLAYKNLGDLEKALSAITTARVCHLKSGHLPYLATVENNLAQIYKERGEFNLALKAADNATEVFAEIGDLKRAAFTKDTKAQILILIGRYDDAVQLTDDAMEMLRYSDCSAMISEVLLTKSQALLKLGEIAASIVTISEAIALAQNSGEKGILKLAQEFESNLIKHLTTKDNPQKNVVINSTLKLDIPAQIPADQDFFSVCLVNNGFEALGLHSGTVAIGIRIEVKPGDLIAVIDAEDLVTIGWYSNDFGVICLTNNDTYPEMQMFEQSEVQIFGKIIGYCDDQPNDRGRYFVKLIPKSKHYKKYGTN